MSEKYLNAFDLLLVQRLMLIHYQVKGLEPNSAELKKIGQDLGIKSADTLGKFFNLSSKKNIPSFHRKPIDTFIQNLKLTRINSWESFVGSEEHIVPEEIIGKNEFIPIGHFVDFSDYWKKKINEAVLYVLKKVKPNEDLSRFQLPSKSDSEEIVSKKLKNLFLNTSWSLYYFSGDNSKPKICRAILRILNTPNEVFLKNIDDFESTDYKGTVEFDEKEDTLILNMKTLSTSKKYLHLKVATHPDKRPEIMLGNYSNSSTVELLAGIVLFEYIKPIDEDKIEPKILASTKKDLTEDEELIKAFFQKKSPCVFSTSIDIFSLTELGNRINSGTLRDSSSSKDMALSSKTRVVISSPKYSISKDDYEKYLEPSKMLAEYFEEKLGFEVSSYPTDNHEEEVSKIAQYSDYFNKIKNCEIFISLLFDANIRNSLIELVWAIDHKKKVFVFSPSDKKILPNIFKLDYPELIKIYDVFLSPLEAVNHLTKNGKSVFKEEWNHQKSRIAQ